MTVFCNNFFDPNFFFFFFAGTPLKDIELSLNKQYVKQKLENGLNRLWNDVQSRISIYLLGHDLAEYKFEELLQILGVIHRLIEIGEDFCSSKSLELEKSIRQQTISYFKSYHTSKLEELRIFLENESWTQCPVRPSFNLLYLQVRQKNVPPSAKELLNTFLCLFQEFKTLRNSIENCRKQKLNKPVVEKGDSDVQTGSSGMSTDGSSYQNFNYFVKYQDLNETPFDSNLDDSFEEDILDNVGVNIQLNTVCYQKPFFKLLYFFFL